MGTVPIFVCLHVGRGCVYSFACMRVGTFACVYGCLLVYVYVSGRALDSTSLIISVDPHHTTMPCRWRMLPVRWWFLAPGAGCSGERRPTLGGRLAGPGPTGLAGPRLGGGGTLGLQGPVCPGVVDCRWSLRACRHGTLGRLHCGCRRSHLRALLCPFLGGGCGCPCGGSPGGPPDVWGPDLFHACFMPCGMGLLFPTHTLLNIYMEEPYEHKRDHTHRCTLKHSHWCKNRCSQTHIVLICCCFKTYFVILVRCAAQ